MKIENEASAGTLESSDAQVNVYPSDELKLDVKSSVYAQFGRQIEETIKEVLNNLDTAAGSHCSIIVAPLIRGRIATVRNSLTSVTTPGETVDVIVTDYGIAVNPRREDILKQLQNTDLPLVDIDYLIKRGEEITGKADEIIYEDKVAAIVEYRDGSIIDVIKKVKK